MTFLPLNRALESGPFLNFLQKMTSQSQQFAKRARCDTHNEKIRQSEVPEESEQSLPPLARLVPSAAVAVGGKINCLSAIFFHPVRTEEDFLNPTVCFSPLFVHHFFGLKEEIYGFSELCIRIFYTVDTFEVYVKAEATRAGTPADVSIFTSTSSDTLESEEGSFIQSRVLSYLSKVPYPGDFHRSEASFLQAINSPLRAQFNPPGRSVARLHCSHGVEVRMFECQFDDKTRGGQDFYKYHRRIEWFLHFFIDACSNIDHEHRWTVLLPFACPEIDDATTGGPSDGTSPKKSDTRKTSSPKGKANSNSKLAKSTKSVKSSGWSGYELVGLLTLYHFFALPRCRRRVSQFLVFPHFQGRNVGLRLLEWVFDQAIEDPDVGEITVEDPAISFRQLRDIVGLRIALKRAVVKPEDFFPEGTPIREENSPRHRKVRQQQLPQQPQEGRSSQGKSPPKKKVPTPAPSLGVINDSEFKKLLKTSVKESPNQIVRLLEILSLAKIIPHPMPPPPINKTAVPGAETSNPSSVDASRDWRHMNTDQTPALQTCSSPASQSGENDFHISQPMKDLRVRIKKRIRMDHIEEFGSLTPNEQKLNLNKTWFDIYLSYYRTIRKIRCSILQNEFQ